MNLYDQLSWGLTPNGVKANKLYSFVPTNGGGDLAFVRTSIKTRINSSFDIETVPTGVPSLDYLLGDCPVINLEPSRTNSFLNSDILVTQGVVVTASARTVSFYGTGTITFSGAFVGSLNGTGADDRVSVTFTPSAGTLTCTVTGSVTKAQIESGSYATSYIQTTVSAVTRQADNVTTKTGVSSLIGQTEGTFYCEFITFSDGTDKIILEANDGTTSNRLVLRQAASDLLTFNVTVSGVLQGSVTWGTPLVTGTKYKVICVYMENYVTMIVNGVKIQQDISVSMSGASFSTISFKTANNTVPFYGYKFMDLIYKIPLTDEQGILFTQ